MILALETSCDETAAACVTAGGHVRSSVVASQAGFRISGVRRGYYTDNREDAYVMWKDPIRRTAAGGASR